MAECHNGPCNASPGSDRFGDGVGCQRAMSDEGIQMVKRDELLLSSLNSRDQFIHQVWTRHGNNESRVQDGIQGDMVPLSDGVKLYDSGSGVEEEENLSGTGNNESSVQDGSHGDMVPLSGVGPREVTLFVAERDTALVVRSEEKNPSQRMEIVRRTESMPEDVCLDILGRLPAKSVLRFMFLSKSWRSLILDNRGRYIDLHYSHHRSSTPYFLVQRELRTFELLPWHFGPFRRSIKDRVEYGPQVEYRGRPCRRSFTLHDGTTLMQTGNLHPPCVEASCTIIGSCNGIVLVMDISCGLYLWNPSIHKVKEVPDHPLVLCIGHEFRYGPHAVGVRVPDGPQPNWKTSIGFGFCQTSKDFKIVHVVRSLIGQQFVNVYSLASNSWEESITDTVIPADPHLHPHVTFDGNPHWIVQQDEGHPIFIISFDFQSDRFQTVSEVQLPPCGGRDLGVRGMHLYTYKGMLCILRRFMRNRKLADFELWALEGYCGSNGDGSGSLSLGWTRVLLLPGVHHQRIPLTFTRDDQLLFWDPCNPADAIISADLTYDNAGRPSVSFNRIRLSTVVPAIELALMGRSMISQMKVNVLECCDNPEAMMNLIL
ncbi:hypothetical protein Tsubulata_039497 [Turnera subulata]|uniref:F-box domain-containing protein n=1 Tax=Turnera subulata TaxID=218843 RepID=A0A9Q0GK03_9ROSI|nr:hypothetical protein Tsubulata_039497 [Turnera subulata]